MGDFFIRLDGKETLVVFSPYEHTTSIITSSSLIIINSKFKVNFFKSHYIERIIFFTRAFKILALL